MQHAVPLLEQGPHSAFIETRIFAAEITLNMPAKDIRCLQRQACFHFSDCYRSNERDLWGCVRVGLQDFQYLMHMLGDVLLLRDHKINPTHVIVELCAMSNR